MTLIVGEILATKVRRVTFVNVFTPYSKMMLSILASCVMSCFVFEGTVSDVSCLSTYRSKSDCDPWDKSLEQVQLIIHLVAMVMDENTELGHMQLRKITTMELFIESRAN